MVLFDYVMFHFFICLFILLGLAKVPSIFEMIGLDLLSKPGTLATIHLMLDDVFFTHFCKLSEKKITIEVFEKSPLLYDESDGKLWFLFLFKKKTKKIKKYISFHNSYCIDFISTFFASQQNLFWRDSLWSVPLDSIRMI